MTFSHDTYIKSRERGGGVLSPVVTSILFLLSVCVAYIFNRGVDASQTVNVHVNFHTINILKWNEINIKLEFYKIFPRSIDVLMFIYKKFVDV